MPAHGKTTCVVIQMSGSDCLVLLGYFFNVFDIQLQALGCNKDLISQLA